MTGALAGEVAVVTGATGVRPGDRRRTGPARREGVRDRTSTRSTQSPTERPETIDDTAELAEQAGGRAVVVRCDFTSVAAVDAPRDRLTIMVDDVRGGDPFADFNRAYWE